MTLFHCDETTKGLIERPTRLQTPLGTVRFEVAAGDWTTESATLTETCRVPGGGWVTSWQHPDFALELLICRPLFVPPLQFPVSDCWAALWRAKAKGSSDPFVLSAAWDEGYNWHLCDGPNGGQHLNATIWADKCVDLTIGTQDREKLEKRALKNNYLPKEWKDHFYEPHPMRFDSAYDQHPIHKALLWQGEAYPLPSLNAGQEFQIQFAVAWADKSETSFVATSLAVEPSAQQILAGGRCR